MQQQEQENAMLAAAEKELVLAQSSADQFDHEDACWATYGRRSGRRLPPPMPGLATTARLACRAPWALRRTYEDDGGRRLVIQEVQAERHEYLKARRGDGRLTLHRMQWSAASRLEEEIEKIERKATGGVVSVSADELKNETSSSSSSTSLVEEDKCCAYKEDARSTKGSACPKEELKRVHQHIPSLSIRSASCNM